MNKQDALRREYKAWTNYTTRAADIQASDVMHKITLQLFRLQSLTPAQFMDMQAETDFGGFYGGGEI